MNSGMLSAGEIAEIALTILTALGMTTAGIVAFAKLNQTIGRVSQQLETLFADKEVPGSLASVRDDISNRFERIENRVERISEYRNKGHY